MKTFLFWPSLKKSARNMCSICPQLTWLNNGREVCTNFIANCAIGRCYDVVEAMDGMLQERVSNF